MVKIIDKNTGVSTTEDSRLSFSQAGPRHLNSETTELGRVRGMLFFMLRIFAS